MNDDEALKNLLRKLDFLDFLDQEDRLAIDPRRPREEIRPTYSNQARQVLGSVDPGRMPSSIAYRKFKEGLSTDDLLIQEISQDWLKRIRESQDTVIEAAVEAAKGACGVRLVRSPSWVLKSCVPDPEVPAGEIWDVVDHDMPAPIFEQLGEFHWRLEV